MAATRPKTRLYCAQDLSQGQLLILEKDQASYLTKVMRLRDGATVGLFNGQDGEWAATLDTSVKRVVTAQIIEQVCPPEPRTGLTLAFAPIKKTPLEWLLVKATELGVDALQPVITQYTQGDIARPDRLESLVMEACEQSERCTVPAILPSIGFDAWLAQVPCALVAAEAGAAMDAKALRTADFRFDQVMIGPEGGFSAGELALMDAAPTVQPLNLGPRILRAETAGVALLTLAMLESDQFTLRPAFRP